MFSYTARVGRRWNMARSELGGGAEESCSGLAGGGAGAGTGFEALEFVRFDWKNERIGENAIKHDRKGEEMEGKKEMKEEKE